MISRALIEDSHLLGNKLTLKQFNWNCSFTRFYAKKALFFAASFSETLTVSKSFRSFFWNWSETANSFNQKIQNRITACKTSFFNEIWVSKNWFFLCFWLKKMRCVKIFFFTQKCLPIFKKCHNFLCFETAKYKFRTRFKNRIGRTIFFNSKCRKVSPAGTWFFLNRIGNQHFAVSTFGQFHWPSFKFWSVSLWNCPTTVKSFKLKLSHNCQKFH